MVLNELVSSLLNPNNLFLASLLILTISNLTLSLCVINVFEILLGFSNELSNGLKNVGYEIKDSIVNGILDASKTVESKIINTSNDIKDKIVNSLTDFGNKMKSDLIETGTLLKDQLSPLGDSFKTMFSDLFNGFLTSFQAKQQEQDNILIYLPLIGLGIGALYIINKK